MKNIIVFLECKNRGKIFFPKVYCKQTLFIHIRPQNCKKLLFLPYYLKHHNRKTILWDLEPNSYPEVNSSSNKIVQYVVDNAKPGSIILLHPMYDNKGNTIGAIKGIIEGLKSKDYEFKTINELLANSSK